MNVQISNLGKSKLGLSLLRTMLVLVLGVGILATVPPAEAQVPTYQSLNENSPEVKSLVKDKKISINEAKKRVHRQAKAMSLSDTLVASVGSNNYGGTWVDSNDQVKVGIAKADPTTANKQREKVKSESNKLQIADGVDVQSVTYSYADLEKIHAELVSQQRKLNQISEWTVSVGIVPSKNAVSLGVPKDRSHLTANQRKFIEEAQQKYGSAVAIDTYDKPTRLTACAELRYCDDPLRGGIGINSSDNYNDYDCTAGFIVVGNSGQRYILTAGHCQLGKSTNGWGSKSSHSTLKKIGPNHRNVLLEGKEIDGMLIKISSEYGRTSRGWVFIRNGEGNGGYNGPTRNEEYNITGRSNSSALEGQRVCQSGATSGSSCGPVRKVNIEEDFRIPSGGTMHFKSLVRAYLCANRGDSGGPVTFQGNALGVMTASAGGCTENVYYTGINAIRNAMGNSFEVL